MIKGAACFAALAAVGAVAQADSFQLLAGSNVVHSVNTISDGNAVSALPFDAQIGVNVPAGRASGDYHLGGVAFDISLQQISNGLGYSGQSTGEIRFSLNESSSFVFESTLDGSGAIAWTGTVQLYDLTAGQAVLSASGANGGGFQPVFSGGGVHNGVLDSGREYALRYDLESYATTEPIRSNFRGSGFPAFPADVDVAYGNIRLALNTTPAAVPLPAAVWAGLGLMGVVGFRRATRRRADVD